MNTRQLKYALLLSKTLNFSQVADQLNITQPALSKQILSLENELGVKLFDRNSSPLKLTVAGEHFIHEAEDLLYKEDQLLRSMERFKSGKEGRLTIGISPFRSLYIIPPIIQKVRERFPGIQICLKENNSTILRKEVAEGKYDFALINLPLDDSLLDITPIEPDTLVLAVPNNMKSLLPTHVVDSTIIDFSDCKDLPFIVVGQTQEMRQLFDRLCAYENVTPHIVMEVVGVTTAWAMCHAGVGATLLPLQFVNNETFNKDISMYTLKNTAYSRRPAIVTKRGQFISEYAQYAIDLLSNS